MFEKRVNWEKIYFLARNFANEYSKEIIIIDFVQQYGSDGYGIDVYPCVQLEFPVKGNNDLMQRLLNSGYCTKMDGHVTNGKRIACMLLWFDQNGKKLSKHIPKIYKELAKK